MDNGQEMVRVAEKTAASSKQEWEDKPGQLKKVWEKQKCLERGCFLFSLDKLFEVIIWG